MTRETTTHSELPNSQEQIDFHKHTHSVQFYFEDKFLLESLSRFIGSALGAGDAGVVIATEEHRIELARRLAERGLEVARIVEQGRYVALDASETLSQFMIDEWPNEQRFVDVIGSVISRTRAAAQREHGRAALFGEMVALLWAEGKADAALRLEQLWNQIAQSHSFSLVCAYPLTKFYREDHGEAFQKICNEHSAVIPSESYALASEDERLRMVAQWQQKALALETEIARRSETEEAVSRLAAIVESSEDAIASKDLNGIIRSWNASAERMFEYKAEEIIGKPVTLVIPPELHKDEAMILSKIRRGERIEHFETVRVTKSGRRLDVSLTVSPLKHADGHVIGAAKIVRDITERKRTTEALLRTEKMAATGQLAATIAHEINNPLQGLTNLLSLIAYKTSLDDNTRQLVSLAEGELSRISHIARQTLALYRETTTPVPTKITEVLEDVLEVFAMRMRSTQVKLERRYEFTGELPGFPAELRQLFANVITNALEATKEKGRVYVHVAPWREKKKPERAGVRVLIADNGTGIPSELRRRIFDPFVTTKAEKGTGLGLWVAKAIVGKHEGSIRFRSSSSPVRSGTVISIFLPLQAAWQAFSAGVGTGHDSAA